MVLYHGTTEKYARDICQNGVRIIKSYKSVDFGMGFYTTPSYDGARKWAIRKAISYRENPSIVKVYADETQMKTMLTRFEDDLRWGRFIINNRNGILYISKVTFKEHNLDARYDITYGRIADLDVYNIAAELKQSCEMLDDISRIFNPKYAFQYAFHTNKGIKCIEKATYRNL